jgi:hypothetical protein
LRSFVDFAFGESGAFLYAPVCKEKKKGSFLKNWLAVEKQNVSGYIAVGCGIPRPGLVLYAR